MNEAKLTRDLSSAFPPNSDKSKVEKKEREKLKSVVTHDVKKTKKTIGQRIKEAFFGDDVDDVGSYLIHEVLVPATKNTLNDLVSGGIEMLLFGERRSRNVVRDRGRSYIPYGNYYRAESPNDRRDSSRGARARHDFDNIGFETKGEAEDVLTSLTEQIVEYGDVSVAEFYDLAGLDSTPNDTKYGWTNLRDAYTERDRDGYYKIRLPQARPL